MSSNAVLPIVTIKIGGKPATQDGTQRLLAAEIRSLLPSCRFVIVHGGGAEVSRISRALGYEPTFRDGVRMTTPGEMDIVDMVLAGKVNKEMVRRMASCGVRAFGLSGADGALITGESIGNPAENRTGRVTSISPLALEALASAGFVPVISTVASDSAGNGLNINADEAALDIAAAVGAEKLIFFSDIPGVMKDGVVLESLDEGRIEAEIAAGTISGGMIPKVRSSLNALKKGVREIIIGEYLKQGDLKAFLTRAAGTTIVR